MGGWGNSRPYRIRSRETAIADKPGRMGEDILQMLLALQRGLDRRFDIVASVEVFLGVVHFSVEVRVKLAGIANGEKRNVDSNLFIKDRRAVELRFAIGLALYGAAKFLYCRPLKFGQFIQGDFAGKVC